VSLGVLFVAVQLADLLWPLLVLAGIERFAVAPGATAMTPLDFQHYPWSHSLVALAAWGCALGFGYRLFRGGGMRVAVVLAALVLSHWVLDFATHRPDMPLTPGESARFGLGLWNSVPATLAVELAMFGLCVAYYGRATRAVDATGRWAFHALTAFLLVTYLANAFGPPPPSTDAVAYSALAVWLLVAWGAWIDRHRVPR
jgi:hypothetical protein